MSWQDWVVSAIAALLGFTAGLQIGIEVGRQRAERWWRRWLDSEMWKRE